MIAIRAKDLQVVFPGESVAVTDVNFDVAAGEFVSIVGPSGCGKSTLLRLIAGLQQPTQGYLDVTATSPTGHDPQSHRMSFVFQEPNLLPWRNVADNIALPLELLKSQQQRCERIDQSLRLIGLTAADAKKRPAMLSGGMKMRVSLARALVTDPHLLLLDEPFAALDDLMRAQLNEDLNRIWSQLECTAVFVTHNVAEAVYLSRERILVMSASPGRIAAEIQVPFGLQRSADLKAEPEFARLCGQVSRELREAAK